jgi:hypothetical protein
MPHDLTEGVVRKAGHRRLQDWRVDLHAADEERFDLRQWFDEWFGNEHEFSLQSDIRCAKGIGRTTNLTNRTNESG